MQQTGWLTRIRGLGRQGRATSEAPRPEPVVRPAPGIAALFEAIDPGRTHAVLDLGAAAESSLRIYGGFARHVRFVDLGASSSQWPSALDEARRPGDEPYDLLLVWDTLERVSADERPRMVARLAELAAPGARLHMILEAPERAGARPLRFSLVDPGRIRYELAEVEGPSTPSLLPSQVERLLRPFEIVRAFTLKGGLREYLAVRPGGPPPKPRAA